MDNANRAGRMMLSARVNPAYIARKAGFCPGAIGDTPVCVKKHYSWMTLQFLNGRKWHRCERGKGGGCVAGV